MLNDIRYKFFFLVSVPLLIVLFFLSLMFGTVSIPFEEVYDILFNNYEGAKSWEYIISEFRLPKAITALLAGAGLAVAGLLMQTFFGNPLAGPYVLGISNGASMGVAILVMLGNVFFNGYLTEGEWAIVFASVLGSLVILLIVLLFSFKVKDNVSLLIIGLMVGSASGAVVSILQYFSNSDEIQSYLLWTFGSLAGLDWNEIIILSVTVGIGLSLSFFSQKALNALLLGEDYARGIGISIRRSRILIITATCLLAGGITAFCGPIAFLGLAVPHIVRIILQTTNHQILIPATILVGSSLLLFCDFIAQLPGSVNTLPINAVTSIIGAPIVIFVVIKARNNRSTF